MTTRQQLANRVNAIATLRNAALYVGTKLTWDKDTEATIQLLADAARAIRTEGITATITRAPAPAPARKPTYTTGSDTPWNFTTGF